MVHTCCVPNCRGNYDKNNKVHIFNFPRDDELKLKWIKAINRKDLVVTKYTRVCEKHFKEDDILFITSFYKEETGETLTAKMKIPRLKEGAIPAIFPSRLSNSTSTKKSRAVSSKFRKQKLPPKTDSETESQNATEPSIAIKQEQEESTDELPLLVIDNIHSMKELVPSTSSSLLSSSSSPFPENALPGTNPHSTNVDETPTTNKPESKRKINDVKPDVSDPKPSATQAKLDRLVIKQELVESTDEQPPLAFDNTLSVEELIPSSSNLPPSSSSPLFISASPFPQNALPGANPDSTVNETPVTNRPVRKRKINDIKPDASDVKLDTSDSTQSATQAKLHRLAKPSTSSNSSNKSYPPSGTNKSAGPSVSPTEDTQNATREIFQSLMSGSGNNPSSGSRTRERPGDLFDMFSVFIAEKLREMNSDNCAFALRAILDIVFKAGQVQQSSGEEDSDISDSGPSTTSSSDQE